MKYKSISLKAKIEFQIKKLIFLFLSLIKKRHRKERPEKINRLLLIRLDGLGDAVLTLPLIEDIKTSFKDIDVDILASSRNAEIFRRHLAINLVFELKFRTPLGALLAFLKVRKHVIKRNYDVVLNPLTAIHNLAVVSGIIVLLLRRAFRVGFGLLGQDIFYDLSIKVNQKATYLPEEYLRLSKAITGKGAFLRPRIKIDSVKLKIMESLFDEKKKEWGARGIVVFHPGSTNPAWRWDIKNFLQLAFEVWERFSLGVILIGDKHERYLGDVFFNVKNVYNLIGMTDMDELLGVIKLANLFIGDNSGPMQLAIILGRPVIALCGPSDPKQWNPPDSEIHKVISHRCSMCCAPYCSHFKCLDLIQVNEVIIRVSEILPYLMQRGMI